MKKHPIYNLHSTEDGRVIGPRGKERKYRLDKDGYFRLNIKNGGKIITLLVHRLVAEIYLGPREEGLTVNHKDLNKQNNHIANLEYLSAADNTRHAIKKGAGRSIPVLIGGVCYYSRREAARCTGLDRLKMQNFQLAKI